LVVRTVVNPILPDEQGYNKRPFKLVFLIASHHATLGRDMTKKKNVRKRASPSKSVDEYLASVPEPARSRLTEMRAVIRSVVPKETTEIISYGMPAFKYHGMLVWFAAFSDHCSLFPTASVIQKFKDELKAYKTSKGTIRFPVDKPFPAALLKKMVKARIAENLRKKDG
jgi:uncharacterized protein YdhG (YjbR/CyaY superfamily)